MRSPTKIALLLFLSVFCGGAVLLAFRADAPVRAAVVSAQGNNWNESLEKKIYSKIRIYGDWPPIMVAAAVGFLVAKWNGNPRWSRIILAAMIASTLAGALANTSRLTTGRTRPRESPKIEQGFYGPWRDGKLLIGNPAFNSFPSGHTATSFGFASVFFFAAPAWGVLVLLGAMSVAWASIAMGAHHPSDVVVSVILSFIIGWIVWQWIQRRSEKNPNESGPSGN